MKKYIISFAVFISTAAGQTSSIESTSSMTESSHTEETQSDHHTDDSMVYLGTDIITTETKPLCQADSLTDVDTECGSSGAACPVNGYAAHAADCDEDCNYIVDIMFPGVMDSEGKTFRINEAHLRIYHTYEGAKPQPLIVDDADTEGAGGGTDDNKDVSFVVGPGLFRKCERFCTVTATKTGTNTGKYYYYCLDAASKCTSVNSTPLPGLPSEGYSFSGSDNGDSSSNCAKGSTDKSLTGTCPGLFKHVYGKALPIKVNKTDSCKNTAMFEMFTDDTMPTRCSGESIKDGLEPCGQEQMNHNTKCYTNTFPGVLSWGCSHEGIKAGKATLKLGNVVNDTTKTVDMTTYLRFFDHTNAKLHPTVKINCEAFNGWIGDRALCQKGEDEYYVISKNATCESGFTMETEDVGDKLQMITTNKILNLTNLVGGAGSMRIFQITSFIAAISLILFNFDY